MFQSFVSYGRCRAWWLLTSAYVNEVIGPIEFARRAYPFYGSK